MANRDFIDEDLLKPRNDGGHIRLGPADTGGSTKMDPDALEGAGRGVGDIELPLMARHKKQVEAETAYKTEEIERLRQLQENLEREKRELEDLRRKQTEYAQGKQEMLDRLQQSLVGLERHELRASQLADLLQSLRRRFKDMEGQIRGIREDDWPETGVREELTKALALIDDARMEFNRSMAKVEALMGNTAPGSASTPVVFEDGASRAPAEKSFAQWVGVGFAVSLPLIVLVAVLALLMALQSAGWLF